jgi:hypothetical protein
MAMELCFLSATEMARLIRRKALSTREVLDAHLRQIERLNPKINAIVTLVEDQARKRAAQLDEEIVHGRLAGVLHGLPIAHKDITDTKGIRTTYGSPILRTTFRRAMSSSSIAFRPPVRSPLARRTRPSSERDRNLQSDFWGHAKSLGPDQDCPGSDRT